MLCAVVFEHPVDLFHLRDSHHITQEDGDFQDRFQHHLAPASQRDQMVQPAHEDRRQDREEQNREQSADDRSRRQQDVLGLFAQMVAHPFFKSRLFLFGVVVVAHAHLRGVHHVAIARDEALDHRDGSPHERDFRPDAVVRGRLDLRLDGPIGLADRTADLLGAAHHDAFHQRLSAHTGFEAFLFWLIHPCLLSPGAALPRREMFCLMIPQKCV